MFVRVRTRPRVDFSDLERDVDRIFRAFWSDRSVPASYPVTVRPDENGVTVRADVPGVEPSAIDVAVEGRTLTISGERSTSEERSDGAPQRRAGKFSRTFHLPEDLDSEAIDAECRNGVLTVRIARRSAAKPRQIAVKAS